MLVLKHGEQKDFEHLYDIFIEIINTPKLQQNILKAKTYEEFLDVLYDGISKKVKVHILIMGKH